MLSTSCVAEDCAHATVQTKWHTAPRVLPTANLPDSDQHCNAAHKKRHVEDHTGASNQACTKQYAAGEGLTQAHEPQPLKPAAVLHVQQRNTTRGPAKREKKPWECPRESSTFLSSSRSRPKGRGLHRCATLSSQPAKLGGRQASLAVKACVLE